MQHYGSMLFTMIKLSWRGDSALKNVSPDGSSMAGGWYDAGGTVVLNAQTTEMTV